MGWERGGRRDSAMDVRRHFLYQEGTMANAREKKRSPVKTGLLLALLLLCSALGACATTDSQVQVRGQYDVAVGTVHSS